MELSIPGRLNHRQIRVFFYLDPVVQTPDVLPPAALPGGQTFEKV